MNLKIAEILQATQGNLIQGNPNTVITQVSTDSRTIKKGDLFVALVGEKFDGHNFLEGVCQQGAIGAVVSKPLTDTSQLAPSIIVQVNDTLVALGDIANCHRRKFDLPIIAITGSNGKTTTKDITTSVLAQRFSVFKSEKSYNNQIGIPSRLMQLSEADEIAVLEIGTSWPGEIERLSQITAPTVGVITNIGPAHLELLGSIEGVAEEKGALLAHVEQAILNADDSMTPRLAGRVCGQITTFGWQNDADISASEIEIDSFGKPAFTLKNWWGRNRQGTFTLSGKTQYLQRARCRRRWSLGGFNADGDLCRARAFSTGGHADAADCAQRPTYHQRCL